MDVDERREVPASVIGREVRPNGNVGDTLPEARAIQTLAADAFHGGRNEAFAHGIFTATLERPFRDFDIKGCYTTAMSSYRAIDWTSLVHTTDLNLLATLDDPATAAVDFTFPPNTKFPCLPVITGDGGLVYPLSGSTFATGPELLLARNMGAQIVVRAGFVAPWRERDMEKADRPFLTFARHVNAEREKYKAPKGAPPNLFEMLAKECDNRVYVSSGRASG
jgi:hypothetical protein